MHVPKQILERRGAKVRRRRNLTLADILTFDASIRIPVSGTIPFAAEVKRIIETPLFQRLRGVRQLGPTHFVYPGALHTRFEHSLGTYALSLRYVEAMLRQKEFCRFAEHPVDMARVLIASALLHDIGHYPFSHLIEEIGPLPHLIPNKHEDRAQTLILDSEIGAILKRHWEIDPMIVCKTIRGVELKGGFAVMASALSGVLDLDKMDYLVRDSIHCGVTFGNALDSNRFLTGLRIDVDNECICLSTKAESYIPTLITIRNLMYNEVYWHKTVRASGAMIKTLIFRLNESNELDKRELEQLFTSQDDRVAFRLDQLAAESRQAHLRSLSSPFVFNGRGLFKMIYVFGTSVANGKPRAKRFFESILTRSQVSLAECLHKAEALETAIRRLLPKIKAGDILVEDTPVKSGHEAFDLQNIRLMNERSGRFVKASYDIGAADDLLDNTRRVFVFCDPRRSAYCNALTHGQWENIFHDALQEESKQAHPMKSKAN